MPFAFCLLPLPALAAPPDPGIDADIRTLLDPRASPNVKIEAAQRLGDHGPAADRAVPALLRQTRYNMEPVRDKARESLVKVAGPEKAVRLLATLRASEQARLELDQQWIDKALDELVGSRTDVGVRQVAALQENRDTISGWRAATEIELLLDMDTNGSARFALDALKKLAQADPKGADTLTGYHRETILAGLERLAGSDTSVRGEILPIIELLGPARAPAVRLLLRCSIDPRITSDPARRDQVQHLLADALDRTPLTPSALEGLADLLAAPDPRLAAAAAARVTPALAADPDFKPALASAVADQVAAGRADALALLTRYDVPPDTFAHRAYSLIATTTAARQQHLRLLRAIQPGAAQSTLEARPELRHLLVGYLAAPAEDADGRRPPVSPEDDELARAAAPLLTGPFARRDLREAIDNGITQGHAPSAKILQAAGVDPRDVSRRLVYPLTYGTPPVRRAAAARSLAALGVAADDAPTRAALERALRTLDDPALRQAAADALNTPRARDLARLPDLLKDLAADRPTTRQVAARQIQSLDLGEPAEVTAALVRATDAGDLVTREGLRLALERSFQSNRPAKDVLADLAATPNPADPASQTYARAALRQLQRP